jgi:hypothetical protein
MRLMSSSRVIELAEGVIHSVIAAYADPNRTFDQFKVRARAGEQADPLKDFTYACREELSVLLG